MCLIESEEIEIDKSGIIWRKKTKKGLRCGGVQVVNTKKRRAEHETSCGYLQVRAMIDGKRVHASAHRLVWQFFNGDIPYGLCINHKNGNKKDNRLENLELATYSKNNSHALCTGLKDQYGEKNPNNTISNAIVEEIRKLYATGKYTQIKIANIFKIPFQTVSKIIRGDKRAKQKGETSKNNRRCFSDRNPKTGRFVKTKQEFPNV